jgi:8-oxo-dGTP diphosphatase
LRQFVEEKSRRSIMKELHVVAGIIRNVRGEILMAQRPIGKAHAGLWEFPGGKVEKGESHLQALQREIKEELDLVVSTADLVGSYLYQDADLQLHLHAMEVLSWHGSPMGLEGQAKRWVAPARLHRLTMPAADRPIALELGLPRKYLITPEPPNALEGTKARRAWLESLERSVQGRDGCKLVLLRAKHTVLEKLHVIAALARDLCAHHGAEILLQDNLELAQSWRFGGVGLTSDALMKTSKRHVPVEMYLAASCHNAEELSHAQTIGCDFVTLAPVNETATHPNQAGMGWDQFFQLRSSAKSLPTFALGGLAENDLATARKHDAWGIAGISNFWR